MQKIFLILLTLTCVGTIFAQTSRERGKIIAQIEEKLETHEIFEFLKKVNLEIQEGIEKKKPVTAMRFFLFNGKAKIFLKYKWFIADTGLNKKWFKKNQELIAYMNNTRRYMQAAEFNGQTQSEKYKKAVKYFDLAYKRFVALLKKPVKVSVKVRRKAQLEKDKWQRAMRKKYKIKENTWYE